MVECPLRRCIAGVQAGPIGMLVWAPNSQPAGNEYGGQSQRLDATGRNRVALPQALQL